MSRNFVLPATPGVARRILRVAKLTNAIVDPTIERLAERDLITPERHPVLKTLDGEQRAAVQFILDCDLRAIIANRRAEQKAVMAIAAAIKIADARPVVVSSFDHRLWEQAAEKFGFSFSRNAWEDADITHVHPDETAAQEVMGSRRNCTLVIDWNAGSFRSLSTALSESEHLRGLASEVRRTIVISAATEHVIEALFPGARHRDLYTPVLASAEKIATTMFNVCPMLR